MTRAWRLVLLLPFSVFVLPFLVFVLPVLVFVLPFLIFMLPHGVPQSRADRAPPPGYVEPCQVAKVQKKGEFCTPCRAWHGDESACSRMFEADTRRSWQSRCQTRGASVWTEIWCTPWASGKKPPPLPQPVPKKPGQPNGPVF